MKNWDQLGSLPKRKDSILDSARSDFSPGILSSFYVIKWACFPKGIVFMPFFFSQERRFFLCPGIAKCTSSRSIWDDITSPEYESEVEHFSSV